MPITQTPAHRDDPRDTARRTFLLRSLAAGWLVGGSGWHLPTMAAVLGEIPGKLPEGRSIFALSGEVWVNDRPATAETRIAADDRVRTGRNSHVVAVVGADAFILRADSELQMGAGRAARRLFRLTTGALLTVFGPRNDGVDLNAPTVTVGIRGTGVYAAVDPDKTYLCTCYGRVDLTATADPSATELIQSRHHDAARYIYAQPVAGRLIAPAPFIDHTDLELMTLEALVGREVPFALGDKDYQAPRRDY